MEFRDPWIDPRITQLGPAEAKAYLVRRGWRSLAPVSNSILEMFERPGDREDTPSVLLPLKTDQGPMLQRMIDLVSELARFEVTISPSSRPRRARGGDASTRPGRMWNRRQLERREQEIG